jgi:integrase/recombinase XerD
LTGRSSGELHAGNCRTVAELLTIGMRKDTQHFGRHADAVERLVARHQRSAEERCPSLKRKRMTPHVLRHTAAMQLLPHGIDRSVIALWLGHESVETTQIYLHADLRQKEEALAKVTPLDMPPGRFRPDDEPLAFLEGL